MKILVIGGAGMIGGHAALYLQGKGHQISIAGRHAPLAGTPLGNLEFIRCDYIANDLPRSTLSPFDAVVFAAGNDVRHLPKDVDEGEHWQRSNIEGVPRFVASVRDAGVRHLVYVGSFYPQAAPQLVNTNSYVRSRKLADEGARALATPTFRVISVNASFVAGSVPGLVVPMFKAYTDYAMGRFAPMPEFTPTGGVNFISTASLSEAIEGALLRGESGKAYLVGDENMSFNEFFGAFFIAAGRAVPPVLDQEHPMLPSSAILWGRGGNLHYQPDAVECELLGYRRNDMRRAIGEIVAQYR